MADLFARARSWAALLAVLALPSAAALSPPPADAAPHSGIQVRRGGPDAQFKFRTTRPGEAFLDVTSPRAGSPGPSARHESAVVSAVRRRPLRHRHRDHVLGPASASSRSASSRGRAHVAAALRRQRRAAGPASRSSRTSASRPCAARARRTPPRGTRRCSTAARREPGRAVPEQPHGHPAGRLARDPPGGEARSPGDRVLRHLEQRGRRHQHARADGAAGAAPPTSSGSTGSRSTRDGNRSRDWVFQAPDHGTAKFRGTYDGTHPLLQTCTSNNNVCDTVDDPMRFSLSHPRGAAGEPAARARDGHTPGPTRSWRRR